MHHMGVDEGMTLSLAYFDKKCRLIVAIVMAIDLLRPTEQVVLEGRLMTPHVTYTLFCAISREPRMSGIPCPGCELADGRADSVVDTDVASFPCKHEADGTGRSRVFVLVAGMMSSIVFTLVVGGCLRRRRFVPSGQVIDEVAKEAGQVISTLGRSRNPGRKAKTRTMRTMRMSRAA